MKKYVLMLAALFVGAVCFTSCGDDEENAIEDVVSGKTKPTVTVSEKENQVVLTAVWKNVATYTMTATFENDVCTRCIGEWTYASEKLADAAWESIEDKSGCTHSGKTITEDLTEDFAGSSKAEVVMMFNVTKAVLEKQEM